MPTYMATDYEPVPPGLYRTRLEKIEAATSQHGTYFRWCFVIEDEGEHEDRKVYANVSDKFGPQSKARRWCEQMISRAIRKGEQFNTFARPVLSRHDHKYSRGRAWPRLRQRRKRSPCSTRGKPAVRQDGRTR
jgi:hypothetical protein